jgi:L-amino acid N-acyltransferase YncA
MVDAYRGTIDYEGETLDEARVGITQYFDDAPVLDCSRVGVSAGSVVSAALVGSCEDHPLIAYVMTAAASKNRGLAAFLLEQSLEALEDAGHAEAHAWITDGNLPSKTIFLRAGFTRL